MSLFRSKAAITTREWDRITRAVDALRGDIGRVRKDVRELDQRVSAAGKQLGGEPEEAAP